MNAEETAQRQRNITIAIEVAFARLLMAAKRQGIELNPCMGLMYLPDAEATRRYQEGCRAVLDALAAPPASA